jgi:DNA-binding Xre family transcriptional regulator
MTVPTSTLQRWDTAEYGNVASTRYRDGVLQVVFEDGSTVDIPVEDLRSERLPSPDWSAVSPGPFWITVPTAAGPTEISWVTLRLLTDPDFAAYWARQADERAHRIGERIQAMREASGLSVVELADRSGLTKATIENIEVGREQVGLQTLERICTALGRTLDDLSEFPEAPSHV